MPYLLKVEIREEPKNRVWYKKGEVHLVLPKTTLSFVEERIPYFQVSNGWKGIRCDHCNIIDTVEISKEEYKELNKLCF